MHIQILAKRHEERKQPKAPTLVWTPLSLEEARSLRSGDHARIYNTRHGTAARVKVSSVKSWKTRPGDLNVNVKHGLYEYILICWHNGHLTNSECILVKANSGEE